jgi:uncharacterized protein YecT (DUF1311 family)
MIIPSRLLPAAGLFFAFTISACDGGARSRTADEFAADSALAADLALANRDTLLVDSIGAYRAPMDMTSADDPAADTAMTAEPAPAPAPAPAPPPARSAVTAPPPAEPSRETEVPKKAAVKLTGTRACNATGLENQSECLRALLPAADARMNRIYRALITEMRRQEGVPRGAKDPASVQRLRVTQRAWLVSRDTECRRRGKGKEGARWARPRVRCLGDFANRRANELSDDFVRLTAR